MGNMRRDSRMIKKYFSQKICVIAAFLSLAATALSSWLIMRILYQRTPKYEEFVTGYTSWTAYYKQGDMTLANLVIAGILIFFIFFAGLLSLLSRKYPWLLGSFDRKKEYGKSFHSRYEKVEMILFLLLFSQFSLAAACGMAAVFCGVTNCPISSLLLSFELFGFQCMPFFLLSVSISYLESGYFGLYHSQKILYSKTKLQFINRQTKE